MRSKLEKLGSAEEEERRREEEEEEEEEEKEEEEEEEEEEEQQQSSRSEPEERCRLQVQTLNEKHDKSPSTIRLSLSSTSAIQCPTPRRGHPAPPPQPTTQSSPCT